MISRSSIRNKMEKGRLMKHKIRKHISNMKEPIKENAYKVREVRWLIPGWPGYQYYKIHKKHGYSKPKSIYYGVKAETIRAATLVSLPIPGSYEIATVGLYQLKKKLDKNEIEKLTLNSFKELESFKKFKANKNAIVESQSRLKTRR